MLSELWTSGPSARLSWDIITHKSLGRKVFPSSERLTSFRQTSHQDRTIWKYDW